MHVSRYYYNRGAYVAAINRAQTAVNNFPQAPATEEALFLMVMSYDKLGMAQLRDDADRVMRKNPRQRVFPRRPGRYTAMVASGERLSMRSDAATRAPIGALFDHADLHGAKRHRPFCDQPRGHLRLAPLYAPAPRAVAGATRRRSIKTTRRRIAVRAPPPSRTATRPVDAARREHERDRCGRDQAPTLA